MKEKTEELLNILLWSADKVMRPTFLNLIGSYEDWAYRNGLLRQISTLRKSKLIEPDTGSHDRMYRLTPQGRLCALGGRDPQSQWSRPWDGNWHLVLFDVPVERDSYRRRLRRYLHQRGFGCLQGSVWVTPHPTDQEKQILEGAKIDVGTLLLLEARPFAGESDAEIVAGAWDFNRINSRYQRLLTILDERPDAVCRSNRSPDALLRWASMEREAWFDAVRNDPLLPSCLLPQGYLGQSAWRRRLETLDQLNS